MVEILDQSPQVESQFDFSGGENSVADKVLVTKTQLTQAYNVLGNRARGERVRDGYKVINNSTNQGRWIRQFEQTTGTVLTFVAAGASYYDETMQPRSILFNQSCGVGDWVAFGARTKFNQLFINAIAAYAATDWTFVWEVSDGGGTFIDKTAQIVEAIANSKKMAGATGAWNFSWPDFSDWLAQQLETRGYLYWLRIRCTVQGTIPSGSDVVHSQERIGGDWLGQRKLVMASISNFHELPGMTLTPRSIETWPTGQRIDRLGGEVLNDYLYYHSNGQRALMRWNGCRGTTRSGASNVPVAAGLAAPGAPALVANPAAGYPNATVLRYRISRLYGPRGILGEGPPSASVEVVCGGAGPYAITVNLAGPIAAAAATDVYGFKVYVTNDLVGVDVSERDRMDRYLLIKTVIRDDAVWNAGNFVDSKLTRSVTGVATPISYVNTPPIKPKHVARGGERLWIADDHFVYASDIRRGDSWNPELGFEFSQVTGVSWWRDRMLVFGPDRIWAILDINTGLPSVVDFWLGIGCVQPDSITAGDGAIYFCSRFGPARVTNNGVELLGFGRVWQSANYWNEKMGETRIAQGAYFKNRWWIPIDQGAIPSPKTTQVVAVYDPVDDHWSFLKYNSTASLPNEGWGALAVVHGTLEHARKNELCLLGFPDGTVAGDEDDLCMLEYGTTDRWTTNAYDGQKIPFVIRSRGLTFGALHLVKEYQYAHVRAKFPVQDVTVTVIAQLLTDIGTSLSKSFPFGGKVSGAGYVDAKWEPCDSSAEGGKFQENASQLQIAGAVDVGFELVGFWLSAFLHAFEFYEI